MSRFLEFAELCDALTSTPRKLEKRALMADYLKRLPVEDAALAALFLSGMPFAETDRRALNVGGALLGRAVAELSGAGAATMHAAYRRYGDQGAAAEDLLQGHAALAASLTLAEVETAFVEIAAARGPTAKLRPLRELLGRAQPVEAKYLIKIISGDMRTGVKQSLVEEAIATAYGAETAETRRALMLHGDLQEVLRMAAGGRLQEARMRLFHPLGFMLASPVPSVKEALERFAQEIGEEHKPTGSAAVEVPTEIALLEAQIEDKYDGIRAQLHCGDPEQPGRVEIFSRNREDIGESFPELLEGFAVVRQPAILDGEVLAWSGDRRALPFAVLQQRFGRKRVTREMRQQMPVVFMAFDLLSLDGALLLELPLRKRRLLLEGFVGRWSEHTAGLQPRGQGDLFAGAAGAEELPRLMLSPATALRSTDQLEQAYAEARARGNEGVMLKARDSLYQPGRRGLAWLKLKRELATLDVVVSGAEFGNGRRAGVLSDYTFAVRDGDELKNVGKAYSGLTDAEIAELTAFFQEHTLEDFGTFRLVEPVVVLEVAFNNIMRSGRHDSGFALRFPRIVRIRKDKPVSEIDTVARVEEIYNSQPDKPIEG